MKHFFCLSCLFITLITTSSCGVKAPPIAPERKIITSQEQETCSAYDPDCDAVDPNYIPKKSRK